MEGVEGMPPPPAVDEGAPARPPSSHSTRPTDTRVEAGPADDADDDAGRQAAAAAAAPAAATQDRSMPEAGTGMRHV